MWSFFNRSLRSYATATLVKTKSKAALQPNRIKNPKTQAIISCKRSNFNLYDFENHDSKFGSIPLASKGWLHNKSKGDHFTLNIQTNPEDLQAEMRDIREFMTESSEELHETLLENLSKEFGITQLTKIQADAIPQISRNNHLVIAAETGCGKTISYLLPILHKNLLLAQKSNIKSRKMNSPLTLILTPGRELAAQIAGVAAKLAMNTELKVKTVLGGNTKSLMMNPDFSDVDVLVGTIGALSKLVTTGIYRMEHVRHLVLDEADTMLDDSFADKLSHFLKRFPFHRNLVQDEQTVGTQLVLAAATMPTNIDESLSQIINMETMQQVTSSNLHRLMPHIEQRFMRVTKSERPANLLGMVKSELSKKRPLIIFSNKSNTSDFVSIFLNNSGVNCLNLNGDMLMKIRLGRFQQFQRGECDVLSTTDISSRGLDTTRARHVINFDFPLHVSDYIHRCGRIGRVGSQQKCLVTNLISSRREIDVVQRIEHAARTGGILPNVNANINNIINKRIVAELNAATKQATEEAF